MIIIIVIEYGISMIFIMISIEYDIICDIIIICDTYIYIYYYILYTIVLYVHFSHHGSEIRATCARKMLAMRLASGAWRNFQGRVLKMGDTPTENHGSLMGLPSGYDSSLPWKDPPIC